ncbi:MAG: methyltransferase family protein [Candidatus Thorarchaeota archaeon]
MSGTSTGYNAFPALLGGINIIVALQVGLGTQTFGVGFWDFLFVLLGAYWAYKCASYIMKAHESREAKIRTQEITEFPKKGIYAKIRHPVGAAFIYFNMACVLLFRSVPLITVALVFGACWFILAVFQDRLLIKKFGAEYQQYMMNAGMFRGKGEHGQRLQDSGYGMY